MEYQTKHYFFEIIVLMKVIINLYIVYIEI